MAEVSMAPKTAKMWLALAGTMLLGISLAVVAKHVIDVHILKNVSVPVVSAPATTPTT